MKVIPDYTGPMCRWPRMELMPGVPETLALLKGKYHISLVTNAADSNESEIAEALSKAGLLEFIDSIYCFKKTGFKKPTPEYFRYVLQDLEASAADVAMVGDDFRKDIMGATACGIYGIWYNPLTLEARRSEQFDTIHSFAELPPLFSSLGSCNTNDCA